MDFFEQMEARIPHGEVRTRFAPSPTGYMHVGNLRTALYTWLIARRHHGKFILRIEDTDQGRLVEGAVDVIYKTMAECGLTHDEGPDVGGPVGPYVQSERRDLFGKYAKLLCEKGGAYYCFCQKDDVEEAGSETGEIKKHVCACRDLPLEEAKKRVEAGEPFVIHPVEVAIILADLRMDVEVLCAALLHDTVEDTAATKEQVAEEFSPQIAELVDGVTKISKIEVEDLNDEQAQTFRKMLVAMNRDIRVVVIKLADRLHNMRTLSALREDRRIFKSRETREIYAPIAHRLGISSIKASDEDEQRIKELQQSAALRDPTMAAAYLASSQGAAMQNAAKNEGAGAFAAFAGINMAQGMGGNVGNLFQMGQQQQQYQQPVQQPVQQAAPAAPAANGWKCECGAVNTGKFCMECGKPQPKAEGWTCTSCGAVNKGKFCMECGAKKPDSAPLYKCDKCGWEPNDPKNPPKFCPQCGDPFNDNDVKK